MSKSTEAHTAIKARAAANEDSSDRLRAAEVRILAEYERVTKLRETPVTMPNGEVRMHQVWPERPEHHTNPNGPRDTEFYYLKPDGTLIAQYDDGTPIPDADQQAPRPVGEHYQNQLYSRALGGEERDGRKGFIHPDGHLLDAMRTKRHPPVENLRHHILPALKDDKERAGKALIAAVSREQITAKEAKELVDEFDLETKN